MQKRYRTRLGLFQSELTQIITHMDYSYLGLWITESEKLGKINKMERKELFRNLVYFFRNQ